MAAPLLIPFRFVHAVVACVVTVIHNNGIVENVMFGKMASIGTGAFDMALDMNMLKDIFIAYRLLMQNILTQVDAVQA
jgi:hypothetical protein